MSILTYIYTSPLLSIMTYKYISTFAHCSRFMAIVTDLHTIIPRDRVRIIRTPKICLWNKEKILLQPYNLHQKVFMYKIMHQ